MSRPGFRSWCCSWLLILLLPAGAPAALARTARAEGPGAPAAPAAPVLDVESATAAYLAKVPPEQRQRSDDYFEGGYWLILWDFLCAAAVLWLVLATGWSARMRSVAERLTRFAWLQTGVYWAQLLVVLSVLQFPLTVYEGFVREHQYHLATQRFGPWLGDQGIAFLVNLVLFALLLSVLYAVLRRVRAWWLWGALVATVFQVFAQLIAPIYIFPLFNTFTRLQNEAIRRPILSLARANGIDVDDVYVFDASRQSTRVSANVSGFLGTQRISLNDNLLNRCSLPEIEASMGHEMGHYVLHHSYEGIVFFGFVFLAGAAFLRVSFDGALRRFGSKWKVSGIGDPAGLPLLLLLFSTYLLAITPVLNTFTRTLEAEADLFGLNASSQPDGAAAIALKLGEYRKMAPGPLEEMVFFDHPSGRTRIRMAMRWKAEHPERSEPPASPAR